VLAQLVHDRAEFRRKRHLEVARARNVDDALGEHAARPRRHHEDAVGEEHGFAQVVGHQHHRDLARRVQVADHAPKFLARERIERAERLVEHQEVRLVDQRAAKRRALLHAAGELPRISVALAAEPDRGEQRLGARDILGLVAADAAAMRLDDLERQQQIVERGAPGQQRRRLERHAGDLDGLADALARDLHASPVGKLQTRRELHQRGLAAAGRSDHGGELAAIDVDRQAIDRERAAGAAVDVADTVEGDESGHG
jgi:hypothetical protein